MLWEEMFVKLSFELFWSGGSKSLLLRVRVHIWPLDKILEATFFKVLGR